MARVRGLPDIKVGKPPDDYTPEHLVVAAVTSCFANSFVYFTRKMHIHFDELKVEGTGVLEKVGRSFEITSISVRARVVVGDEEIRGRILRALELGAKYCFVGNSLKANVGYAYEAA